MDSKFDIGDIVVFEGELFKVTQIHFLNPQIPKDPYVCRLVRLDADDLNNIGPAILVREGLLSKADSKAPRILYGSK